MRSLVAISWPSASAMRRKDGSAPLLDPQKTQMDFMRRPIPTWLLRRFRENEAIAKRIAQGHVERAPFGSRHLGLCEPIVLRDELRAKLLDAGDHDRYRSPRAGVTVM